MFMNLQVYDKKKSLGVKHKYSRNTVDNDSGIWDLHLIAWSPAVSEIQP